MAERFENFSTVPVVRISHGDDEMETAAPSGAHSNLGVSASAGCLVGAVDVGGDFKKVDQQVRNVLHQPFADIFELERDVLEAATERKAQCRIFPSPPFSTTQNETLRHSRLSACAIRRAAF